MKRFVLALALLLSLPTMAGAQFFWLQFLTPVTNEAALPACTDGSVYENHSIFTKTPAPGSWYHCPDGGGTWACVAGEDCPSGGGGGGSAIVLDLGDDAANESAGVLEIATTGDTHSIFTEPAADKLLVAVGNAWPLATLATTATTANAGDSATAFFSSGTVEDARIDAALARDAEVAAGYQPLDADLTSIAAIVTTGFGRGLLALADQAALLAAAGGAAASHTHGVGDITGEHAGTDLAADLEEEAHAAEHQDGGADELSVAGLAGLLVTAQTPAAHELTSAFHTEAGLTIGHYLRATGATTFDFAAVLDADLPASLSRDTESPAAGDVTGSLSAGYAVEDDSHAHGASTISGLDAGDTTTGTFADARIDAAIHRDAETKDGDLVSFDDGDANFAATDVDSALSELDDDNASGPNAADGKVEWSQLVGVPAGFADETDDGGAGGMPDWRFEWTAASMLPIDPTDLIPPIGLDPGTNNDWLQALADASTEECRKVEFEVPAEAASGDVEFVIWSKPVTPSTNAAVWRLKEVATADGETDDAALATHACVTQAYSASTDITERSTCTVSMATLDWVVADLVSLYLCRNGADAGADDLAGDAALKRFKVSGPSA